MSFWDTSAVVPLLVDEPTTDALRAVARGGESMSVWWATEVECMSAIARRERARDLSVDATVAARRRLERFAALWVETHPSDGVRRSALRLVQVHPLRTADALQLAAALVAAEGDPGSLEFVTLDERLADAARREGFVVRGV